MSSGWYANMSGRGVLIDNPEEYSRVSKSEYEAGDKSALMRMIIFSALNKSPIPEWAAAVLDGAAGFAAWGELKSWDDVFGKPSRRRRSVIEKWQRRQEVWAKVVTLSERGRKIDDDLFDEIGRELAIGGKTEVKRLYSSVRDELRDALRRNAQRRK